MAADSSYLSMTELAHRLDLPESTMRYYCKRFARFLPYKGEGRRRRYAQECEKTLVFIASSMHRNKNATAVELMLQSGQFGRALPATATEETPAQGGVMPLETGQRLLDVMERQTKAMGNIAAGLEAFVSRLESGAAQTGSAAAHGDMYDEIQDLKKQIVTAEKIHQEDLEQLRKWIARISEAMARRR